MSYFVPIFRVSTLQGYLIFQKIHENFNIFQCSSLTKFEVTVSSFYQTKKHKIGQNIRENIAIDTVLQLCTISSLFLVRILVIFTDLLEINKIHTFMGSTSKQKGSWEKEVRMFTNLSNPYRKQKEFYNVLLF